LDSTQREVKDRLGSVRALDNGQQYRYLPYGEEEGGPTPDGRVKFATYERDSTASAQDYAQQRYYSNVVGRFYSPDPGGIATANPKDPGSWNRYAYVGDDPVSMYDPEGLVGIDPWWETYQIFMQQFLPWLTIRPANQHMTIADYNDFHGILPKCNSLPTLPSNIPTDQIQQNIDTTQGFYGAMQASMPPDAAFPALLGFLAGKFAPGGDWDYKSKYNSQTQSQDYKNATVLGNFDFGAVLQSFDFDYKFTQSAAGTAQIAICILGGSCGTGIPFLKYPFGDQTVDAMDIKKGFDYEAKERSGCK
jgi:RHS repeat-associated protein